MVYKMKEQRMYVTLGSDYVNPYCGIIVRQGKRKSATRENNTNRIISTLNEKDYTRLKVWLGLCNTNFKWPSGMDCFMLQDEHFEMFKDMIKLPK